MSLAIQRAKYTGDPGIFGDIFRGIKGAVGGAFKAIAGVPDAGPGGVPTYPQQFQQMQPQPRYPMALPFVQPRGAAAHLPPPSACPPGHSMAGYHLNKSDYFLRDGTFVPKGTKWVKNRKRNPANARATSRAISRVVGAKRYAQSLNRVSVRKPKR